MAPEVATQAPAVTTPSKGNPKLSPTSLSYTDATKSTSSLVLSNTGGEPFDFRVLSSSPAFTVTPFEGRVSGEAVTLTVALDRAALGGSDTAYLMVNTTAGSRRVPISVAAGVDGVWAGTFFVESPVALGQHVASFNLTADAAGKLSGMVVGDRSPLWPVNVKVTGAMTETSGVQGASFSFRMVAPQGTTPNPAVPGTIERLVTVTASRVDGGGLQGTFVETIHGLVGAELQVKGSVTLRRTGPVVAGTPLADSTTTVGPVEDPFIDSAGATRAPYVKCQTQCPGGCTTDDIDNGDKIFNGLTATGARGALAFYDEFNKSGFSVADKCVTGSGGDCLRLLYDSYNLYCSQYWYAKAFRANGIAASNNLLDTMEVPADAALYEGNAAIAKAFDTWYSGSLSEQIGALQTASTKLLSGLYSTASTPIAFADPAMATYLSKMSTANVAAARTTTTGDIGTRGAGEQLRRAVLVINNVMFVADQKAYLLRKQRNSAADAAKSLRDGIVTGYLAIEALGPALSKSNAWDIELASTRTNWHQLLSDLSDVTQDRNALGFAPGYVPFLWNKDLVGLPTNYLQILATAKTTQSQWATSYASAFAAGRSFEGSEVEMKRELAAQQETVEKQFDEVCGAAAVGVEDCGSDYGGLNASLMAQARLDYMGTVSRVQLAVTQMSNLKQEIKIEQDRAAKVAGVHTNNANLIRDTGGQVMLLDYIEGEISIHQKMANDLLDTASQVAAGAPWASAGVLFGAAKAAVNAICGEQKLALEQAKARLTLDERSRIEFSYGQIELINSAAVVATKNLQLDALFIESSLAYNNLAQSLGRINSLFERAQGLIDSRARAQSLGANTAWRVLHSRVFASHESLVAARDQRTALQWAYLATRALEYQLNASIDQSLMWSARSPTELNSYLEGVLVTTAASAGSAQTRVDVISLRDNLLGLNTPIQDVATGRLISAKERFRQFVMEPRNRDENGNFHIQFLTNDASNPLFSSLLGSDRIRSVKMNLIGDDLGPGVTTADVQLIHGGTSHLRAIIRDASGAAPLTAFDVSGKFNQPRMAIVQAGVNAAAAALRENTELQERAVLAGPWQLVIDQSPANANLNLAGLDDIELTLTHDAYTIQ